jgi:hypothetical protein
LELRTRFFLVRADLTRGGFFLVDGFFDVNLRFRLRFDFGGPEMRTATDETMTVSTVTYPLRVSDHFLDV